MNVAEICFGELVLRCVVQVEVEPYRPGHKYGRWKPHDVVVVVVVVQELCSSLARKDLVSRFWIISIDLSLSKQ